MMLTGVSVSVGFAVKRKAHHPLPWRIPAILFAVTTDGVGSKRHHQTTAGWAFVPAGSHFAHQNLALVDGDHELGPNQTFFWFYLTRLTGLYVTRPRLI